MTRRAVITNDRYVNIRDRGGMQGHVIGRLQPGQSFAVAAEDGAWLRLATEEPAYVLRRLTAGLPDLPPAPVRLFDPDRAAAYAEAHSSNRLTCAVRNHALPGYAADCANFVHQCLAAGGMTVFDGWMPRLRGQRGRLRNGWPLTDTGRCALLSRGRITAIPPAEVRRGDILYSYRPNAPHPYRYPHVVIAVSDYDEKRQSCLICGHTRNQHHAEKKMDARFCRCYRVMLAFIPWEDELALLLPTAGDGAALAPLQPG